MTNLLLDSKMQPFRENLYNWYRFEKNCRILYLCYGIPIYAELFKSRANRVDIVNSNELLEQIFERLVSYDYIVIDDAVDTLRQFRYTINKFVPHLLEGGRLLFVCTNRFGMKYWCGVNSPVSEVPFAGIRQRGTEELLTRASIVDELEKSEKVGGYRIYYPFPDHLLTQAVYTDEYMPKKSIRDRVIPYYSETDRKHMVFSENEICDDVIRNNMLGVMANSFLLEVSASEFKTDVVFATLSSDRGTEHGFSTVITADDTVIKSNIYAEGKQNLVNIYNNSLELEKHGVLCVSQKLREDSIVMPYIKKNTLADKLKELIHSDVEEFIGVFDRLYEIIRNSSDRINFEDIKLHHVSFNKDNIGPILSKAYIDMIPYNAFYMDGDIVFYDQEFVKEGYPAKYVLFRAIRYTYIYIPDADEIVPIEKLKERYELKTLWKAFEEEEARFVEDNRNYELYDDFYKAASIKSSIIDRNILHLTEYDEAQEEAKYRFCKKSFDINPDKRNVLLNSIHDIQLGLYDELVRVCDKYDLSYAAFYGTLLGTVRHKGYIPWDDDLDIVMPREDYDKLLEVSETEFKNPFFLQYYRNDSEYFCGGYAKLRNSETTAIVPSDEKKNFNQGIWIDIFPIDEVDEDTDDNIKECQRLIYTKISPNRRVLPELSIEEEIEYREKSASRSFEVLYRQLEEAVNSLSGDKLAVVMRYYRNNARVYFDRKDFEFLVEAEFEGRKIYLPNGYENVLKQLYGEDYLLYSAEMYRAPHHIAKFDVTKSYKEYLENENL